MAQDNPGEGALASRRTGGAIASISGVALLAVVGAFVWVELGVMRRHRRRKERRAER